MKTRSEKMKFSVLTLAVQGALALMYATPMMAHAEDDEVAALTRPKSFIEAGGAYVSDKSAKFGEYNGLNDSGGYFIGNFGIRGGDAYDSYDGGNGTTRWEINGNDLGTTSRSLGGAVNNQGKWNLRFDYDELRHNISDTYQTPLQGSMGGNNFTLPSNFGAINSANGTNSTRVMNATQLGAMHQEDIYTTRHNTSFGAGYNFNDQWSVKLDYNHLDQSGSKLIAGGTQGGVSLFRGNVATSTGRAEAVNILMNPTNYTTDTMEAAVNWVGEKGFFTGGYFGSIFRDGYNSLTWQSSQATGPTTCQGNGCFVTNTMSTAPDNSFHQLNLKGGYYFTSTTKLVGGLSYGRGTQDDGYASAVMQAGGLPQSSLNGEVITTHADVKLTNQTTKDLMLSAGFRFNERDNKTDSSVYKYVEIGNANYTGVNTPYSNKKTQFDLAADYRITKGQSLRLTYEHEDIKRWCNSNATPGAECVANTATGENKYGLTYRLSAGESVKLNAGYAYADRKTDLNHTFLTPIGPTPQAGMNAGDVVGFVAFPYASRTQNILKGGVNWGVTERFDIGLSGRYSYDNYDETLGMQSGRSESVNMDATYSFSEQSSLSLYATWQQSKRNLKNGANGNATTVPTQIWDNQLNQRDMTVGVNTKHTGFFGGKLDLLGDLSYSNANSSYLTQISYLPTATTCGAATTLTCGETPDITAKLLSFKISGAYSIDKHSKIGLLYLYQNLKSNDYYYNTYQYGYTPNRVMPTNEQSPNYSINVLAATYMYTF